MPMSSMAEAIKKVRLRTTLVLRLIWNRFMDMLFPPLQKNNGLYSFFLKILQHITNITVSDPITFQQITCNKRA